jgi:hypothetical protein
MFSHLSLSAQNSRRPEHIELFLKINNFQRVAVSAKWSVTLPPHLKATSDSKPLYGTTTILPSEEGAIASSWTIQVLPLRNESDREIVAVATLTIGTDFKEDSVRETLSSLLKASL